MLKNKMFMGLVILTCLVFCLTLTACGGGEDGGENDTVYSISLNKNSIALEVDETYLLVATTTPSGGTVVWQSDDNDTATVTQSGLVKAIGAGSTVIHAVIDGDSASCMVTVTPKAEEIKALTYDEVLAGLSDDDEVYFALSEQLFMLAGRLGAEAIKDEEVPLALVEILKNDGSANFSPDYLNESRFILQSSPLATGEYLEIRLACQPQDNDLFYSAADALMEYMETKKSEVNGIELKTAYDQLIDLVTKLITLSNMQKILVIS